MNKDDHPRGIGKLMFLSALCGVAFTSLVALSLNLTFFSGIFLLPGGLILSFSDKPQDLESTIALFVISVLIYSFLAFAVMYLCRSKSGELSMRTLVVKLMLPVAVLLLLACIPRMTPLWPQGMADLGRLEATLQGQIHSGMTMEQVQNILRSKGIHYQQETEISEVTVLKTSDFEMEAAPGDQLISSRFQTNAGHFPCNYELQVFLLFGKDEKLREQYIHRHALCP